MTGDDLIETRYRDRRAAAQFLTERGYKTAPTTLARLACVGGGPAFRRFGRKALYDEYDLIEWARSRLSAPMRSTSEPEQLRLPFDC
jgi:hypothetical protein